MKNWQIELGHLDKNNETINLFLAPINQQTEEVAITEPARILEILKIKVFHENH